MFARFFKSKDVKSQKEQLQEQLEKLFNQYPAMFLNANLHSFSQGLSIELPFFEAYSFFTLKFDSYLGSDNRFSPCTQGVYTYPKDVKQKEMAFFNKNLKAFQHEIEELGKKLGAPNTKIPSYYIYYHFKEKYASIGFYNQSLSSEKNDDLMKNLWVMIDAYKKLYKNKIQGVIMDNTPIYKDLSNLISDYLSSDKIIGNFISLYSTKIYT